MPAKNCKYYWTEYPTMNFGKMVESQCWINYTKRKMVLAWSYTEVILFSIVAFRHLTFNKVIINVDDSRQSTSWSRQSSLSGKNYCSFSSIAPLVSGVAGLSGSSRSKANKLIIWCKKNYSMWVTVSRDIVRFYASWIRVNNAKYSGRESHWNRKWFNHRPMAVDFSQFLNYNCTC